MAFKGRQVDDLESSVGEGMDRRHFLKAGGAAIAATLIPGWLAGCLGGGPDSSSENPSSSTGSSDATIDWPVAGGNIQKTYSSTSRAPANTDKELWRSEVNIFPLFDLIEKNSVIYAATEGTDNAPSRAHAISAKTGKELWKISLGGDFPRAMALDDIVVFSHTSGTTAIGTNGKVVWTSDAYCDIGVAPLAADNKVFLASNNINALDIKNGKVIWEYKLGENTPARDSLYFNGKLYVLNTYIGGPDLLNPSTILMLDAKTGKRINSADVGTQGIMLASNGKYLLTITDGSLRKMLLDTLEEILLPGSDAKAVAINNNTAYFVNGLRRISAVNLEAKAGALLWETKIDDAQANSSAKEELSKYITYADGKLFVGASSHLYILDATTGKILSKPVHYGPKPIIARGTLFLANAVASRDASGRESVSHKLFAYSG